MIKIESTIGYRKGTSEIRAKDIAHDVLHRLNWGKKILSRLAGTDIVIIAKTSSLRYRHKILFQIGN